jgi:hypothetical protein
VCLHPQLKVKALVLDLIHNMDVVEQLVSNSVMHLGHWQWQKQLRFYVNAKGKCTGRMCDAECVYTYEYQVSDRAVCEGVRRRVAARCQRACRVVAARCDRATHPSSCTRR